MRRAKSTAPRTDLKVGDVMGGVAIRIPID